MNTYSQAQNAKAYLAFLESEDGKIQQDVLGQAILKRIRQHNPKKILDAACGTGWLTHLLDEQYHGAEGCDSSMLLLGKAQERYPHIRFTQADVQTPLPYAHHGFDTVVLNMAATDLDDQFVAFKNLYNITEHLGRLIVTIPNPYYSFPVGVWKRTHFDKLLQKKPHLIVRNYYEHVERMGTVTSNKQFETKFYSLAETLNHAAKSGWVFHHMTELHSSSDDADFTLQYQLFRFPLLLLLEFVKPVAPETFG